MEKLIIDLSKGINDPNRARIVSLTEEESKERLILRDKTIADEKADKELNQKRNELITEIATKLDVNRDELAEVFGIRTEAISG